LAVLAILIYSAYLIWRKYWQLPKLVKTYHPHKVKKDEDLQSIAKKYNTDWKHLAKANKLKAPYTIDADSIILVPNKDNKNSKKNTQKGD
jgi:LysM repeat protein